MNWRTDVENAYKDCEILVYETESGVRVVKWDFNNCGYTIPWRTWCVVDTGNEVTINSPSHWCEITRPHWVMNRTILRIVKLNTGFHNNKIEIRIASWNPNKTYLISKDVIPQEFHDILEENLAFILDVNTGAENFKDLLFENFEISPLPIEDSFF